MDVFFTLSGFLITALLVQEHNRTGAISFRRFYIRRALRLLPALVVLVTICELALLMTVSPEFWPLTLAYVAAVLFYVANWASVWGLQMGVFNHTWSLAIEEQFYLLWPLTLAGLLRVLRNRRATVLVVVAGVVIAIAYRIALSQSGASIAHIYRGLDAHADPLLIGSALGLLLSWEGVPASRTLVAMVRIVTFAATLGLIGLFATAEFPRDYVQYQVSALAGVATALIMVEVFLPRSRLAPCLENPVLVALGRISYGVYLWHFPIFYLFGTLALTGVTPSLSSLFTGWIATLAVAAASFYFLERPALRLKQRFSVLEQFGSDSKDSVRV